MEIVPHPQILEALFTSRTQVSAVFKEILGINEINHIAICQINSGQLLTFSSTPAMEFNLFNSTLWRYDRSYHYEWLTKCTHNDWQSLYSRSRFDELYYLKQIKHHYPIGYTLAAKVDQNYTLYSFASHNSENKNRELFIQQVDELYKIGQYCSQRLSQLFGNYLD